MKLPKIQLIVLLTVLATVTTPLALNFPSSFSVSQVLDQTQEDRKAEADRLLQQGNQQFQTSYPAAIESWQKSLAIYREIGERQGEALSLNNLGNAYVSLGQYPKAIEFSQQSLIIQKDIGERNGEARSLNNLGNAYVSLGQYSKAIEFSQQSKAIFQDIGDRQGEAGSLNNLGNAYRNLGQYPKAIEFSQQSLAIQQDIGDRQGEAGSLNNLGNAYVSLGQYPEAIEFYRQSKAIFQDIGDREGEAGSLTGLGIAYVSLGQYLKAIEFSQQSKAITRDIGDRNGEARSLTGLGNAYRNLGQYPKAIEFYQQSKAIQQDIGDRRGEAGSLTGLGNAYASLGQYPKAIEFYRQSKAIKQDIGDRQGEAGSLTGLGIAYDNLGQYPKAIEFYQQSKAIFQDIGDRQGEAGSLNNLGNAYVSLGQYPKAIEFYQQSKAIFQDIGDRNGEARSLNNLGIAYRNLGQYPKAIEFYQQSLAIQQDIGDRNGEAGSLTGLGNAYFSLGQYPKAIEFYQQSLAIKRDIGDRQGEALSLNNLGATYYQLKQYSQAEQNLLAAIEVKETLRVDLTDRQKISIFETQTSSYRLLQQTLIAQNKETAALEISERGRARAFVELLASKIPDRRLPQVQPLTLPEIQQIAQKQKATLVEYSVVRIEEDRFLYIWVVKPTGEVAFQSVALNSLNTSLAELVKFSRDSLGVRGNNSNERQPEQELNPTQQKQNRQRLYQLLIEPIADLLPENEEDRVIFIPHQELFFVPFPALQDANYKYLIEKHTILTAPSIQSLDLTRQHQKRIKDRGLTGDVLVVGNPTMPETPVGKEQEPLKSLRGAETEAKRIEKLLNNVDPFNVQLLLGNQATETTIVQQMPNAQIIHLATHGLLDDLNAVGSPGAIALAPSGKDDGFLTTAEIMEQHGLPDTPPLNAELIVLSACDTGRGTITGDGVIGLSRSLIAAGVPSVVVSLWKVDDDATTELMTEFYTNLYEKKLDKAQALRQAMLMMFKNNPDPKDWAAFTLIGEVE